MSPVMSPLTRMSFLLPPLILTLALAFVPKYLCLILFCSLRIVAMVTWLIPLTLAVSLIMCRFPLLMILMLARPVHGLLRCVMRSQMIPLAILGSGASYVAPLRAAVDTAWVTGSDCLASSTHATCFVASSCLHGSNRGSTKLYRTCPHGLLRFACSIRIRGRVCCC